MPCFYILIIKPNTESDNTRYIDYIFKVGLHNPHPYPSPFIMGEGKRGRIKPPQHFKVLRGFTLYNYFFLYLITRSAVINAAENATSVTAIMIAQFIKKLSGITRII